MILTECGPAAGAGATLDDLFRRAGVRRHDALALLGPLNRETLTAGSTSARASTQHG